MKINKKNIELVSPAGNINKAKTALAFGADALYLGIPDYSLRTRVNNFNVKDLKKAAELCHNQGKKIYITLNIFAHNKHINNLPRHMKALKAIGVDGIILSDPGVMSAVKEVWPQARIHLSTQANCTNWRAVKFWSKRGVKRIILGREVTLKEIKEIKSRCPEIELEYFVHGAMCMAYSGRCFLSKYYKDRSANLGDCIQPCRWIYTRKKREQAKENEFFISAKGHGEAELEIVEEKHGSYILNSKDLCLIKYLDKLKAAGISSFKIEGRAKSIYYQAVVTGIYRQAINLINNKSEDKSVKKEINELYKELDTKLVHRGYTTGFLARARADQNLADSHNACKWEFCGEVIRLGAGMLAGKKKKQAGGIIHVRVHNSIKAGDQIEIVFPIYDIIKMKVKDMADAETGKKIIEAHGGQGRIVILEYCEKKEILPCSVVRRRVNN
ncbi:U32 family peptidase [Candidatus Falkowbacteria bacterium]|nr:MAG: U32 family peptidase [Candidatus Falkowbacteria bacterium]